MLTIDKDTLAIKIIAKDTGDFILTLDNYILASGDEVYFTINDGIEKEQHLLQKKITEFNEGCAIIFLTSDDTDLPIGDYYYDV